MNAVLSGGWEHGGGGGEPVGEHMQNQKLRVSFFQGKPKYPLGVVLTLPGEGSVLGRLGVEVQVLAKCLTIPRPGAGVTLPTQYYIPDTLDIGVLEGWGLTFDQTDSVSLSRFRAPCPAHCGCVISKAELMSP